jgi:phosphinothricin acetyltransferase
VRLHEGLGFRYVGSFREVGLKFSRWQDVAFYQAFLPDEAVRG